MSLTKKILFLVEGSVAEKEIVDNIVAKIIKQVDTQYIICSYETTIYELYEALSKDDDMSTVGLLIEQNKITLQPGEFIKQAFSQIYLVFDYEPNYQKYSDERIKECLEFFNDETENGKLYINYPMVEATFFLNDFNSPNTFPYYIPIENCIGDVFKKEAKAITCYKKNQNVDFSLSNKKHIFQSIRWNYKAYIELTKSKSSEIDHKKVLEKQIELKNRNVIMSLSLLVLLVVDYNPSILRVIEQQFGL